MFEVPDVPLHRSRQATVFLPLVTGHSTSTGNMSRFGKSCCLSVLLFLVAACGGESADYCLKIKYIGNNITPDSIIRYTLKQPVNQHDAAGANSGLTSGSVIDVCETRLDDGPERDWVLTAWIDPSGSIENADCDNVDPECVPPSSAPQFSSPVELEPGSATTLQVDLE